METFEQTCEKPYDRHLYKITLQEGEDLLFDDYETMRLFWFTHFQVSTMTCSVLDKEKPKTKLGFA